MREDEMVGWHHQLNGHEFDQALGVGDGHVHTAVFKMDNQRDPLSSTEKSA